MRYHVNSAAGIGDYADLDYPCNLDACTREHVHVTDDDLNQHGHERLGYGNAGRYLRTGYRSPYTHVAIPVEQYVRIFGEL